MNKQPTNWREVPCPCGKGTIPGALYEAGKRTCGAESDPPEVCECGHDGLEGHDMREATPRCMTFGCSCGAPCPGCEWAGEVHIHLDRVDGPRAYCCDHTPDHGPLRVMAVVS